MPRGRSSGVSEGRWLSSRCPSVKAGPGPRAQSGGWPGCGAGSPRRSPAPGGRRGTARGASVRPRQTPVPAGRGPRPVSEDSRAFLADHGHDLSAHPHKGARPQGSNRVHSSASGNASLSLEFREAVCGSRCGGDWRAGGPTGQRSPRLQYLPASPVSSIRSWINTSTRLSKINITLEMRPQLGVLSGEDDPSTLEGAPQVSKQHNPAAALLPLCS